MKTAALTLLLVLPSLSGCFGAGKFTDTGPLVVSLTDFEEQDENRLNLTLRLHNTASDPLTRIYIVIRLFRLEPSLAVSYGNGVMRPRPDKFMYIYGRETDSLQPGEHFNFSTSFYYEEPRNPRIPHTGHEFQMLVTYVHEGTRIQYSRHHCIAPDGEVIFKGTLCTRTTPTAWHRRPAK